MGLSEPGVYVAVCAPTYADVQRTCFEGASGILREAQPGEITDYNKNNLKITLRNGSVIQGYSAEKADSIRGANLSYCWFDELAMIRYAKFFDYGLKPALRVRPRDSEPRLLITTTPKKMRLIRDLVRQAADSPARVHLTRARSEENPYFAAAALDDLRRQYRGTFLERQELEGELIEEADGALFTTDIFDENRVEPRAVPPLRRIAVAIDPATTSSDSSDETGIIVAAEGEDHHWYTLADCSLRGTPGQCMTAVAAAYRRWDADVVVGEKNGVGDYMRELLAKTDPNIPFTTVHATRGKHARAQPVSLLAAQGRIHMAGVFDQLETQLCSMTPDDDRSLMHDDRADAWVWAMRELTGSSSGSYKEMYGFSACSTCGADIHETRDQQCRQCGTPVTVPAREHDRRVSANRWAAAYQKTCPAGHDYPSRHRACPQCGPGPAAYLARALALQNGTAGPAYTPRDWLTGRKL